jgi:large subunit ribosomal protein L6
MDINVEGGGSNISTLNIANPPNLTLRIQSLSYTIYSYPTMSRIAIRQLHSTCARSSHIGSTAIIIPKPVDLQFPFDHPASSTSTAPPRTLSVSGPLGRQALPIPNAVVLENQAAGLVVRVLDAEDRKQRSLWGLTRTLINNAVVGVSTGYTLELRLVGVGYRASVEQIPEALIELSKQIPRSSPIPIPTQRVNLKLGYAHPVYVDIPEDIRVATPAPTSIILSGTDKQKLGLFAAKIRRWRKPEPYRGKVSPSPVPPADFRVFLSEPRLSSSRRSRKSRPSCINDTVSLFPSLPECVLRLVSALMVA